MDENRYHLIAQAMQSHVHQYRALAHERSIVRRWEADKPYSILGVVELYSSYVCGYGAQIVESHGVADSRRALQDLAGWDFFAVDYCARWYADPRTGAAALKRHIRHLEYLRALVIAYIRRLQRPC